jgi:hypothetical protein
MTSKQISKRIEQIRTELDEYIAGTGAGDLISELVELEIELEKDCNL